MKTTESAPDPGVTAEETRRSTIVVTHFSRRPGPATFSIERLFEDVRRHLPPDIEAQPCVNRFPSQGIVRRLRDAFHARRHQGDVNHVTGDVHYLTCFLDPRRTVLTVHDLVSLRRPPGLRRALLWLFWYWLPVRRCAAITVISESTRRQLLEETRCDPARVRVVHNTVSAEFRPAPREFDSAAPRVLHIGTKPNKNLGRHIVALRGSNCTLVVIGRLSDDDREAIERSGIRYESHAIVTDEELLRQYACCDLLLFASTYEGFGLPIVEAQAVGRPVVTSNIWSMPEVAGGAACLVDPFSVDSIREGVDRVVRDEEYRRELVSRGYENVARFRSEVIAEQYAEVYRTVRASA